MTISHSIDGPELPDMLHSVAREAHLAGPTEQSALLPIGWNPSAVYLRDGHAGSSGFELSPGGEIWIRLSGLYKEIAGIASVPTGPALLADPVVRVLFYKGSRLDVLTQSAIRDPDRQFEFNAWSPEPDGWLVIMLEPNTSVPPVRIKLLSAKTSN